MTEDYDIGGPLPEESGNRTFVIAAAILGGLLIISMIFLAVYALILGPRQREASEEQRATEAAAILLQNTEEAMTQTAEALGETPTSTPEPTDTPEPPTATPTQVVVLPSPTSTPFTTLPTLEPAQATAAAQETQAAAQGGVTPTATALPSTGFADEVGLPMLAALGGVFILAVILARSLRISTAKK